MSREMTVEEYEALQLFGIQKYHGGMILCTYTLDDGMLKHYEFYRKEVGKKELLILSLGDNLITASTYHTYEDKYDIVSVGCFKEEQTKSACLHELFEYRIGAEELPTILRRIKSELDQAVKPYMYAYFGE